MSPKEKLPAPHFATEKSSLIDAGRLPAEFAFETFAPFVLAFEFRLATRELEFLTFVLRLALVFEFELMLASARIMTAAPTTKIPATTSPPRIHQTAFDFFRGGIGGTGDHCRGWAIGST